MLGHKMKITAFILLFLFLLLATESKKIDKHGRKGKGKHGKGSHIDQEYDTDSESRAVAVAVSPPASGQFIRLAGDNDFPRKYFEGRVEVYVGGKWGIVCDDNWDIEDAHVACRQLGFTSGAQEAVRSAGFGTGSWDNRSILMDEVNCHGDEARISECSRQLHHDCTQQESAGVRCVENSGCLDDWISSPSGCYKLSSETVNTRDMAENRCAENGGHLLTIETERENNFISNVLYALGDKEFSGSVLTGGVRRDNIWFWQIVTWSFSPPADEDISFINLEDLDLDNFDFGDLFRSKRIKRASREKGRMIQGRNRRKRFSEMNERTSSTSIPYFKWFPGWIPGHVGAEPSNRKYDDCIFLEKDYEFVNGSKVDVDYYFWKDEHCNTTRNFMPDGFHYMCEIEKEQLRVPDCYLGNGADYRGFVSTTQQGTVCLKWNDPASTNVNPKTHPYKGLGDHSYCRNPDGDQRPWCWVSHTEKKFGFCDVPKCEKEKRQTAQTTTITTTAPDNMCGPNKFYCPSDDKCISSLWKCDAESDCLLHEDEVNCEYKLPLFNKFPFRGWMTSVLAYEGVPVETCARVCVQTTKFVCRSFSYSAVNKYCYLSNRSSQDFPLPPTSFKMDYYERKGLPSKEDCVATGMLTCDNSRCVGSDKACDGVDDCGDSSDESEGRCGHAAPIEVRLADGDDENSGRVEIKYLGKWGVVCDDKWDIQDANVVCRMLGYDRGAIKATTLSRFGNGNGDIMLDDTECNGTEESLADCQHPPWKKHDCHQWETAGVICQVAKACDNDNYQCPDGGCVPLTKVCTGECHCTNCEDEADCNVTIQLVGGATPNEGRVEVIINGIRGTVCDDGWNANAANVTCKSLGYVYGVPLTITHFGEGSGPIWFDDVSCTGREKSLGECPMTLRGENNCLHKEDAGVKCSSEKPVETVIVRLRGGRTKYEGNVVVTKDGRSGYMCDDEWDDNDARVICRMLGFQGGKAYSGSHFRVTATVSGIILDDVQCTGNEPSLSQCSHKPWGQHDCTDSEYAGVGCLNPDEGQDINITIGSVECGKRPLMERQHQRSKRDESEEKQLAPPPKFEQIIGGMNAVPGANPWQVGVRINLDFFASHWCGGTILSEYWILSAAHCFRKYGKDDIVVRAGDYNNKVYDDHEQEFKIDVLITHERYDDDTVDYDIALIKIRPQDGRGIVFNDYVQPACLPESNTEYEAGMKCHISGWGKMFDAYPNILQSAIIPIISESVCKHVYKEELTPRMFCAGYLSGRVDSCAGDSGGPLVCDIQGKYTVIGATSWGRQCAVPNSPGVYAKVKEFLQWIKQKMQLYSKKR
ncbi:hypothetical protein CHS0354_014235 [Potamilus streckersoni]|uniref:Serine protease 12 n=1 Tax=Potamilus streckersoni TaxID=2493646 RepID=A0AAE0VTL0_9BIVA|nr:hypothetical protein CHS0354_014235 [Potamilus streckersoni]